MKQQLPTLVLLTTSLYALPLSAQSTSPFTVEGSLAAGAEYNSNVSVAELESASGQSDIAAVIDGSLDLGWQATEQLNVSGGISYSSHRYQDFDAFDLDMLMLYADISYDWQGWTLGANHYHADAELGGRDFLILKQSSIYAGRLMGDQWYLRGALNTADKSFTGFSARDADTQGLSLDAFWFFNQGQSSLVLGYAYDDEDTRSRAFAYEADTLRARLNHRFSWLGRDSEVQVGIRHQQRDYKGITPVIGVPRDDRQTIADARLNVNLTPWLAVTGKLERGDYRSRLASADYTDERVSVGLELSF